ncbi:MAG: glutathione S-transferase family protein [Mesorhizobium sp.]
MSLTLHFHPLASFCWKALIALYENDTPFVPNIVDLGDEQSRTAFFRLWPLGKFPVLQDSARGALVPESSIIVEYLALHYPGRTALVPADPEQALQARLADRLYDFHLHEPMQKVVLDRLRPEDRRDPLGVEQARAQIRAAYDMVERDMAGRQWALGEAFSMADCAAFPALFYADRVEPLGQAHADLAAYLARLRRRPSVERVVQEARPYFRFFPYYDGRDP